MHWTRFWNCAPPILTTVCLLSFVFVTRPSTILGSSQTFVILAKSFAFVVLPGFPDHKGGNAIVEGAVSYPMGPTVWSDQTDTGVYAWTLNTPGASQDDKCPPIPSDSKLDSSLLTPIALVAHGPPISACMLACNMTRIAETGVDPCNAGAITTPVVANYSCMYGGSGWLDMPEMGMTSVHAISSCVLFLIAK